MSFSLNPIQASNHGHCIVGQAVAFTVTDEQPVKYLFEDEVTSEKIKVWHSIFKVILFLIVVQS